ncbi:MAG TPA: HAMP domain-containing sensor histidine kinase [Pyrinomonadaceae bacterium]
MSAGRGEPQAAGVALACDRDGFVREVVSDGLGLAERLAPGRRFAEVCDAGCADKAEAFFAELRRSGAAFGWELVVRDGGGRLVPLHFAGGAEPSGGFLVVGARSRAGVARAYEGLLAVNNEQANALRAAAKDLALRSREAGERDAAVYEELTRLNNELAAAQRELAKKNAELARINAQKNQFLGLAAHDLRNPLDVINVYSGFLLDEAAARLSPEQLDFVGVIRRSSDFMLALIDDLLDVSKIEAGRLELELDAVDLRALAGRNVELNRRLAERKKINILFTAAEDVPPLRLDASKIEQVLNNLVGNAVKFSPRGATVEVALGRGEGGAGAVILVRDEGPGVPADELDKLFKPFSRTRVRSTEGERSTGLGLAIVKRIVEGHGGSIGVESPPGGGATFAVRLPAEPPSQNPGRRAGRAPEFR